MAAYGGETIRARPSTYHTALALHLGLDFSIGHLHMTVFDLVGLGLAATMLVLLVSRVARNLREIGRLEPGASRRIAARGRRSRLDSPAA